jgi:hypothetical protein
MYDTRRQATLRAKITLLVTLVKEVDEGQPTILDAAATKARIEALRATASY